MIYFIIGLLAIVAIALVTIAYVALVEIVKSQEEDPVGKRADEYPNDKSL